MVLVGLYSSQCCSMSNSTWTYEGKTAIAARADLGSVCVDKNLGVTSRAATTLTSNNSIVSPSHRLLVNHLHRRLRLGLSIC